MKRALVAFLSVVLLLGSVVGSDAASAESGPVGAFDSISEHAGGWTLFGWLWDPTEAQPLVSAEVNGEPDGYTMSFGGSRPDVVAAFPGAPENTGFALELDRPLEGTVCLYALSSTLQKTAELGCRVFPPSFDGSPGGALDEVTPDVGRMTLSGWVADADAPTFDPSSFVNRVHVYVDGRLFAWLRTGVARPDVEAAFPFAGPNAGYRVVLPARPGPHTVCVYGLNAGPTGRNVTLGCRDVVVAATSGSPAPFGFVDGSYLHVICCSADNELGLTGWAAAPDQAAVEVRVIAVGGFLALGEGQYDVVGTTGESRPDVVDAYPGTRPDTGFHIIAGGGHIFGYTLACAIARITTMGGEAVLGCVSSPYDSGGF